jgi:hypothetical protein
VLIVKGPPPGVELRKGRKVTALFRFFALKRAQVRGFLCKMDGRAMRPCRSPRSYRVGLGRHVFRVRAIGWTGLRAPVAELPFEVCRPTKYGSCIRRLPPVAQKTG